VLLVREDIDWMLAFFLICFTCGCGLFIYLIIYYSKPENRCVHCYSIVPGLQQPTQPYEVHPPSQKVSQPYEVQTPQEDIYEISQNQNITPEKEIRTNYCPYCGEKIEENARFCAGCGAKII